MEEPSPGTLLKRLAFIQILSGEYKTQIIFFVMEHHIGFTMQKE
jgi:hypothetical protein